MTRFAPRAAAMAAAISLTVQPALPAVVPLSFAAALIGCSGQTSDQLTADVQLIATGLSGVVSALSNPALTIPADVLAQAQAAINDIESNAAQVGSALTPNANAVQAISTAVTALATLLTPYFGLAPIVAVVVQAALALVPELLSMINAPVPAASASRHAVAPASARLVLMAAPAMLKGN